MADYKKIVPFILKFETGQQIKKGEDLETYFNRARKHGFANDPVDRGGATCCGVTIATFTSYRLSLKKAAPSVDELKSISLTEWLALFKKLFWDKWQADKIQTQGIANLLVDWVWASGSYGITKAQSVLGVVSDGIVGQKTLNAVNSGNQTEVFAKLKKSRVDFVIGICVRSLVSFEKKHGRKATEKEKNTLTQYKFKNGWLRRINAINFNSLD